MRRNGGAAGTAPSEEEAIDHVDHVDVVVSSLERSLTVYRDLRAPLGFARTGEILGERGERVVYVTRPAAPSARSACASARMAPAQRSTLTTATPRPSPPRARRPRPQSGRRGAAIARTRGLELEDDRRKYDYSPRSYAVFIHDPDGLQLALVHAPRGA